MNTIKKHLKIFRREIKLFFHPDFTVGTGISPVQPERLADYNRRSGISPCLEDMGIILL